MSTSTEYQYNIKFIQFSWSNIFRSINIIRVQVEYLHSLNVSITEAIVKMSHVRFNGNIYFPAATKQDSAYNIFSFTHHVLNGTNRFILPKLQFMEQKKTIKLYEIYTYMCDLVNDIEFAKKDNDKRQYLFSPQSQNIK